jgi:hypothetical protein
MTGSSFVTIALAVLNVIQVVSLAWIGREQKRSRDERERRIETEQALG